VPHLGDYNSPAIAQEVKNKIPQTTIDGYLDLQIYIKDESNKIGFNGAVSIGSSLASVNPWFWLDPDALCTVTTKYGTNCSGYLNSAHEFGHSLGLAHPWDMDINKDSKGNVIDPNFHNDPGNIISYANAGLLSGDTSNPFGGYYVMTEEKQKMILP